MKSWLLIFPLICASHALAEDQDKQPLSVGYGGNMQVDPKQKLTTSAGMGADMTPDGKRGEGAAIGYGAHGPTPDAGTPAKSQAPASAAQAEDTGIYRSTRGQASVGSTRRFEETSSTDEQRQDGAKRASLSDAAETLPSLVESYVETHGKNGYIKLKSGKKQILVRFSSVQHGTVRRNGSSKYAAVALFYDKNGHAVMADVAADFSGSDWKVTKIAAKAPAKKRRR